jgi:transposase
MARPSKIFLRKLRKSEKELLRRKLRDKTMSARIYERYRVIDVAQQGFSVPDIAERSGMHVTSIYDWIAHFNDRGFGGFDDVPNPDGRPSLLTSKQLREMVKIALSRPTNLGLPYTHWSVAKLRAYLMQRGLFPAYT